MASSFKSASFLIESRIADAARGDADALFELGVAYSSGSGGIEIDLVQAHKWFNLAALSGVSEASALRADVASDMAREDIAEAQRQARAWLNSISSAAAARHAA